MLMWSVILQFKIHPQFLKTTIMTFQIVHLTMFWPLSKSIDTLTPSTFTCWKINPQGSLEHRFFGCIHVKSGNVFALNMLNHLQCRFKVGNPWKGLKFEHCVFGKRLTSQFNIFIDVWCCFLCLDMWTIWLDQSS